MVGESEGMPTTVWSGKLEKKRLEDFSDLWRFDNGVKPRRAALLIMYILSLDIY